MKRRPDVVVYDDARVAEWLAAGKLIRLSDLGEVRPNECAVDTIRERIAWERDKAVRKARAEQRRRRA